MSPDSIQLIFSNSNISLLELDCLKLSYMTKSPTKHLYLASKTFNNFLIPSLQVCQNPQKLLQTPANSVQLCPFGNFFPAQRNFMSQRKSGKATIRFFLAS